jgi:hypothetical protein
MGEAEAAATEVSQPEVLTSPVRHTCLSGPQGGKKAITTTVVVPPHATTAVWTTTVRITGRTSPGTHHSAVQTPVLTPPPAHTPMGGTLAAHGTGAATSPSSPPLVEQQPIQAPLSLQPSPAAPTPTSEVGAAEAAEMGVTCSAQQRRRQQESAIERTDREWAAVQRQQQQATARGAAPPPVALDGGGLLARTVGQLWGAAHNPWAPPVREGGGELSVLPVAPASEGQRALVRGARRGGGRLGGGGGDHDGGGVAAALPAVCVAALRSSDWQPDEDGGASCGGGGGGCGRGFGWLVRRHHCRRCGLVFCDECTPFRSLLASPDAHWQVREMWGGGCCCCPRVALAPRTEGGGGGGAWAHRRPSCARGVVQVLAQRVCEGCKYTLVLAEQWRSERELAASASALRDSAGCGGAPRTPASSPARFAVAAAMVAVVAMVAMAAVPWHGCVTCVTRAATTAVPLTRALIARGSFEQALEELSLAAHYTTDFGATQRLCHHPLKKRPALRRY